MTVFSGEQTLPTLRIGIGCYESLCLMMQGSFSWIRELVIGILKGREIKLAEMLCYVAETNYYGIGMATDDRIRWQSKERTTTNILEGAGLAIQPAMTPWEQELTAIINEVLI